MYPPSSLLTLPLEVRQHIYSYLLINPYPAFSIWHYQTRSRYCLSLTCRQLYLEVVEYYFAKNVLWLSLVDYGRLPSQLAARSKRKAEQLEFNLRRVQHLQLIVYLYGDGLSDPLQMEQPEWFRGALLRAKQGSVERCPLKSLDIQVCGSLSWSEFCGHTAQRGTDKKMAPYKAFLQPFIGMAGKLTVLASM